jgi:serine/threonine protein phosphatase 1
MRLLAIGDIHGCLGPLDDLLSWVDVRADDQLVFLGDYVDRGPDSCGVLTRLIALRLQRRVVCLRGNHEIMMLEAWKGGRDDKKMWLSVGGVQTLGSYGTAPGRTGTFSDVPREHWDFLEHNLLDYYETERFIFVHAGVSYGVDMDEQADNVLYWEFLGNEMRHQSGKTVVVGHTSQKTGEPKVVPGAACIDTYCHGGGWLTCLDAETGRYWQTDALGRRREGQLDYDD